MVNRIMAVDRNGRVRATELLERLSTDDREQLWQTHSVLNLDFPAKLQIAEVFC
jgi:hypothetical protein